MTDAKGISINGIGGIQKMGKVSENSLTIGEAVEYPIEILDKILKDLKPYVWVVGSYANNAQRDVSDIDLQPKRRPIEEMDELETEEEYYESEIRQVIKKWNLPLMSKTIPGEWCVFWHRYIDIAHFDLPSEEHIKIVTKPIPYVYTIMDCLEYDRSLRGNWEGFEAYEAVKRK
jgi:hypothetical protein